MFFTNRFLWLFWTKDSLTEFYFFFFFSFQYVILFFSAHSFYMSISWATFPWGFYQYFWFKYDLGQKYQAPQVRPDWGSNSWPPDHDRTFHVTETPALTTRPSVTSEKKRKKKEMYCHIILEIWGDSRHIICKASCCKCFGSSLMIRTVVLSGQPILAFSTIMAPPYRLVIPLL